MQNFISRLSNGKSVPTTLECGVVTALIAIVAITVLAQIGIATDVTYATSVVPL